MTKKEALIPQSLRFMFEQILSDASRAEVVVSAIYQEG